MPHILSINIHVPGAYKTFIYILKKHYLITKYGVKHVEAPTILQIIFQNINLMVKKLKIKFIYYLFWNHT